MGVDDFVVVYVGGEVFVGLVDVGLFGWWWVIYVCIGGVVGYWFVGCVLFVVEVGIFWLEVGIEVGDDDVFVFDLV